MRKIFYVLGFLTIFNGWAGAQGGATCTTINIYCPDEQNFLDTVEAKLLHTVDRIKKGEKIPVSLYKVAPNVAIEFQHVRLNNQEIKNEILPKKYLPTYRYELIIDWNDSLNTGYVLGFSKEYGYEKNILEYSRNKGEQIPGIYIEPFYHVPLSQYKNFLTQKEVDRLYKIIKKNFINYINIDTAAFRKGGASIDTSFLCQWYSDTSSLSKQTIPLDYNDPFILMPLYYWVNRFKDPILGGEWQPYKDPWLNLKYSTHDERQAIFTKADTVLDENGNKAIIAEECPVSSISVGLKWTFDTANISRRPYSLPDYAMRLRKEIQSIAIITHCDNGIDKYGWLSFKDIDEMSKKQRFHYYRTQLDNALFKKLNLQYYKY